MEAHLRHFFETMQDHFFQRWGYIWVEMARRCWCSLNMLHCHCHRSIGIKGRVPCQQFVQNNAGCIHIRGGADIFASRLLWCMVLDSAQRPANGGGVSVQNVLTQDDEIEAGQLS